jgi:hypothetical protein
VLGRGHEQAALRDEPVEPVDMKVSPEDGVFWICGLRKGGMMIGVGAHGCNWAGDSGCHVDRAGRRLLLVVPELF